ncbi:MAG: SDR family oxidoreductase [Anaerolineales bacterium]|nr:SDR family oxidoreductase [Anaerolineales bacterium]
MSRAIRWSRGWRFDRAGGGDQYGLLAGRQRSRAGRHCRSVLRCLPRVGAQHRCLPGFVKPFSAGLEHLRSTALSAIPQHRMAEPDEIAGISLYLAARASDFTTGATFLVDGGQAIGNPLYALFGE